MSQRSAPIDISHLARITNPAFFPLFFSRHRFVVMIGGGGSGKSYFVPDHFAVKLMREKNHHAIALRKVARTCRTSVYAQFIHTLHRLGVTNRWQWSVSTQSFRYTNGNCYRCLGMDDPEKIKSIVDERGLNPTLIWLEEATEFTEADFNQLNLRLRGHTDNPKQIFMSLNPISSLHWIRERFEEKMAGDPRVLIHRSTYKDNLFLDQDYIDELESLIHVDEELHKVYARGEWGLLRGLIFPAWPIREAPDEIDDRFFGLDFGYNNPTALVQIDESDAEYYLKTPIYETHLTTNDLIEKLNQLDVLERWHPIYCDSADPDKIEELRRAGFNAKPSVKDVYDGLMHMKALTIYVDPSADALMKEQRTYKWQEDRRGNPLDVPVKFNDHAIDASRYGLYTHTKRRRPFRIKTL